MVPNFSDFKDFTPLRRLRTSHCGLCQEFPSSTSPWRPGAPPLRRDILPWPCKREFDLIHRFYERKYGDTWTVHNKRPRFSDNYFTATVYLLISDERTDLQQAQSYFHFAPARSCRRRLWPFRLSPAFIAILKRTKKQKKQKNRILKLETQRRL